MTTRPERPSDGSEPSPAQVKRLVRESLGLPPVSQPKQVVLMEGHVCEFPLWSFSKKRSALTRLRIDYGNGKYALIEAPRGFPSVTSPGYLDVLLCYGQKDLFETGVVEMSAYRIMRYLDIDPNISFNYRSFVRDMKRNFVLTVESNRLKHPDMAPGEYTTYFRILDSMVLTKRGEGVSRFYFNKFFLRSLDEGYLKRLDFEFCLDLDRNTEPLARFLYGHLVKRLGKKAEYRRSLAGLLTDIGYGHVSQLEPKRQNDYWQRAIKPALDKIQGHAFDRYYRYESEVGWQFWFVPKPE